MQNFLAKTSTTPASPQLAKVESDSNLIEMWLHGKSPHSERAYRGDIDCFLELIQKPLRALTLGDVQGFVDSQRKYKSATQNRRVSAVKSLLTFGHKVGYLPFNPGAPVDAPKVKNTLAERILSESEVLTMIALEKSDRNRLLLRFLYYSGARVSEVSGLKWRDLKPAADGCGTVTLFGKGEKTRAAMLPASLWKDLQAHRGEAGRDEAVFQSRKGGEPLQPNQIRRIVAKAGERAKIEGNVSPHWLRHSHASHSLDRGAPVSLVASTLGHASVAVTSKYLHAKPNSSSGMYLP
jgi:integrase/recombinase XerD